LVNTRRLYWLAYNNMALSSARRVLLVSSAASYCREERRRNYSSVFINKNFRNRLFCCTVVRGCIVKRLTLSLQKDSPL
jgi:hypothetical protein